MTNVPETTPPEYQSLLGRDIKSKQMPKAKKLPEGVTDSMHRALLWLESQGGEGAWLVPKGQKKYAVLAKGEIGKFEDKTWMRLEELCYLDLQQNRIRINFHGHKFLKNYPKPIVTIDTPRQGRVDPYPGAE